MQERWHRVREGACKGGHEMVWARQHEQDGASEMVQGRRGCMQGRFEMVGTRWYEGDGTGEMAQGKRGCMQG